MRYGLLSTAAVAALALSVAAGIAQTSGSGAPGATGGAGMSGPSGAAGGSSSGTMGGGAGGMSGGSSSGGAVSGSGAGTSGSSGSSAGSATQQRPAAAGTGSSTGSSAQSTPGQSGTSATQSGQASGTSSGAATTGSVPSNLTTEQRTQITRSFSSVNVRPATNVNFSIATGVVVPTTVEWHDLPAEVVRVIPAYRGYKYSLVGNRIVIIEPSSRKIVTVIERTA
jgi:hypothetical protein